MSARRLAKELGLQTGAIIDSPTRSLHFFRHGRNLSLVAFASDAYYNICERRTGTDTLDFFRDVAHGRRERLSISHTADHQDLLVEIAVNSMRYCYDSWESQGGGIYSLRCEVNLYDT